MSKKEKAEKIAKVLMGFAKGESKEDAKQIRKLANLVKLQKNAESYKFFKKMDTYVREGVPDKARTYLCLHRVAGKKISVLASVKIKNCKKIFHKDFSAGVIFTQELVFPPDATKDEISMGCLNVERDILDSVVGVEFKKL